MESIGVALILTITILAPLTIFIWALDKLFHRPWWGPLVYAVPAILISLASIIINILSLARGD